MRSTTMRIVGRRDNVGDAEEEHSVGVVGSISLPAFSGERKEIATRLERTIAIF